MSTQTVNIGLELPSENDFYDINIINANNQKIDTEFKNLRDHLSYMPVNGGSFIDGNNPIGPTIDGGTY